jgi:hypothetical protein
MGGNKGIVALSLDQQLTKAEVTGIKSEPIMTRQSPSGRLDS